MAKTEKGGNAVAVDESANMIPVYLPLLPDETGIGEVDQRVVVTVNGTNRILLRGQTIYVTREEYEALYNSHRFDRL